jgi:hypothetical protein
MPAWVRYLVRPPYEFLEAALCALSRRRARLLAERPLELGTPVLLDLPSRPRLVRVVSARASGAGDYFVQCRFAAPLSHRSLILLRQVLGPAE